MFNAMRWETTELPAPQIVTPLELITVCRLLEGAKVPKETFVKFEILRDYALQHEQQTGRAYISLQAH